ncbi:hypothetical protein GF325_03945 [Candidatus Bathyarchaeota archaeon]|nr:hypothetical protein [Candidatus Bathyarchaeota archaeon]
MSRWIPPAAYSFIFPASKVKVMNLHASTAQVVINPPIGTAMGGYMPRASHSLGIHDDLHAKAVVFSDGTRHAVIVIMDLVVVPFDVVDEARKLISTLTPIPAEAIMIGAIHTHSGPGPALLGVSHAQGFETGFEHYMKLLPYHVAGLVYSCYRHLEPCSASASKKEGVRIGHHRRTWDEGSKFVDDELVVINLEFESERSACLYNVGTHAVKMNPDNFYISADFPGFTASTLERVLGGNCTPIFFQAPCGNINPWNQPFTNPRSTFEECEVLGRMLAGDVLSAMGRLASIDQGIPVRAGERIVEIPVDDPALDTSDPDDIVRAKVQAIALGDQVVFTGVPGEPFSKFGHQIRQRVQAPYCIVQELLSHDLVGEDRISYIPTREAIHARDENHPLGGYEVNAGVPNPNTGDIIVNAVIELANQLIDANRA